MTRIAKQRTYGSKSKGSYRTTSAAIDGVYVKLDDESNRQELEIITDLSAENGNILTTNTAAANLAALNADLIRSDIHSISFNNPKGGIYLFSGTINGQGKTLKVSKGCILSGGTFDNVFIDAGEYNVFSTTTAVTNLKNKAAFLIWFGAVANDAAAIASNNTALARAHAAADIMILPGNRETIYFDSDIILTSRKEIHGSGPETSILEYRGNAYGITNTAADQNYIKLKDFTLNSELGGAPDSVGGIYLVNLTYSEIERVYIFGRSLTGFSDAGLIIESRAGFGANPNTYGIHVKDVRSQLCKGWGLRMFGGGGNLICFDNCNFETNSLTVNSGNVKIETPSPFVPWGGISFLSCNFQGTIGYPFVYEGGKCLTMIKPYFEQAAGSTRPIISLGKAGTYVNQSLIEGLEAGSANTTAFIACYPDTVKGMRITGTATYNGVANVPFIQYPGRDMEIRVDYNATYLFEGLNYDYMKYDFYTPYGSTHKELTSGENIPEGWSYWKGYKICNADKKVVAVTTQRTIKTEDIATLFINSSHSNPGNTYTFPNKDLLEPGWFADVFNNGGAVININTAGAGGINGVTILNVQDKKGVRVFYDGTSFKAVYSDNYSAGTGIDLTSNVFTNKLSTGVATGQSVIGGVAASENLTLSSTAHATKGKVKVGTSAYDEVNNRLGVKTDAPKIELDVVGKMAIGNDVAFFNNVADINIAKQTAAKGIGLYSTNYGFQLEHPGDTDYAIIRRSDGVVTEIIKFHLDGVGIGLSGATLPSAKLHVNGTTRFVGASRFDLGSDATGDIFYRNVSGNFVRLPIGVTDQILSVQSGLPSWGDVPATASGYDEATQHTQYTNADIDYDIKLITIPVSSSGHVEVYWSAIDSTGNDYYVGAQMFSFKKTTAGTLSLSSAGDIAAAPIVSGTSFTGTSVGIYDSSSNIVVRLNASTANIVWKFLIKHLIATYSA